MPGYTVFATPVGELSLSTEDGTWLRTRPAWLDVDELIFILAASLRTARMLEFVGIRSLTPRFGPWVVSVGLDNGLVTVVARRGWLRKRTATFYYELIPQAQAQPPKPELRNPTWH